MVLKIGSYAFTPISSQIQHEYHPTVQCKVFLYRKTEPEGNLVLVQPGHMSPGLVKRKIPHVWYLARANDFARAIALLIKSLLTYAQIRSRSNEKKCNR